MKLILIIKIGINKIYRLYKSISILLFNRYYLSLKYYLYQNFSRNKVKK